MILGLSLKQQKFLGYLFICLSLKEICREVFGVGVPFLLILPLYLTIVVFSFKHIFSHSFFSRPIYILHYIYFLYVGIHFVYGLFMAYNYWQYKDLLVNVFTLLIPIFSLLFAFPIESINILRSWNKVLEPKNILFFLFPFSIRSLQLSVGPTYCFYFPFLQWLSIKWKIIVSIFIFMMFALGVDERSQLLKASVAVMMYIAILNRKWIPLFLLRICHWLLYLIPIILLVLGATGTFNIFSPEGVEGERKIQNDKLFDRDNIGFEEEDLLTVDTRTFAYVETVNSALQHNYVIWGRSPSRGNDTKAFASRAMVYGDFIERSKNELCHLNIFTWMGAVGVFLYSLFYMISSFCGLYRSNNIFIKFLSVFIAFHWAWGWVEDVNDFTMMNVALWMIIGLCYSPKFRRMDNNEFELWFRSLFSIDAITPYHRYVLNKECESLLSYEKKSLIR